MNFFKGMKKLPYPGLRNIKTALSMVICLCIYKSMGREGVSMAAIAALICMQDSVEKSIQIGANRVLGTIIGGVFGIAFTNISFIQLHEAIWMLVFFILVVLLIYVCNLIKKTESIVISCVVFVVIALSSDMDAPLVYSINRVLDTLIGIVTAFLVNRFLFRPKAKEPVLEAIPEALPEEPANEEPPQ